MTATFLHRGDQSPVRAPMRRRRTLSCKDLQAKEASLFLLLMLVSLVAAIAPLRFVVFFRGPSRASSAASWPSRSPRPGALCELRASRRWRLFRSLVVDARALCAGAAGGPGLAPSRRHGGVPCAAHHRGLGVRGLSHRTRIAQGLSELCSCSSASPRRLRDPARAGRSRRCGETPPPVDFKIAPAGAGFLAPNAARMRAARASRGARWGRRRLPGRRGGDIRSREGEGRSREGEAGHARAICVATCAAAPAESRVGRSAVAKHARRDGDEFGAALMAMVAHPTGGRRTAISRATGARAPAPAEPFLTGPGSSARPRSRP